ncbi:MAG: insulinase family protein [Ignavibacteriales bacterium]|nr:insulinase family protein [Ignavibacteriales bacterium]
MFNTMAQMESKKFSLPPYEKVTLSNGLTVYLMERHEVPLIYITAVFPAGAVNDGEKNGLASFTSDALLYGTKSFTKNQIEETFDFFGANINTNAGTETSTLSTSFIKDDADKILPILKEIIVDPVFPKEEIDKRQQRWLVELEQAKESPRSVIRSYFNKFIFANSVYGNPVNGTSTGITAITQIDIQNFYKSNYQPSLSAIAIVGDFSTSEMKEKISSLFGNWESVEFDGVKRFETPELKFEKSRVLLVNKSDSYETTFLIGGAGVTRNNSDFVGLQVINTILGGRFTSWLNDELRVNSGLTYGARSSFVPYKFTGTFLISTFTKTSTTIQAIDLALETYNRLWAKGIDDKTLSSAKNYIKGQFPPDYETSGDLANLLSEMFYFGLDDSFINDFEKNVDALTIEKSKELINKYFPKDKLQFVLIGKADELRSEVKKYGEVLEKEITAEGF